MAVSGMKQHLTRSVLGGSDEDMPVCSPCENGGRLIEAHGFCSNCKKHLCETCYKSHLRPKLFRNHVLLDKTLMPREVPPPDDMCPKHTTQHLEYYCKSHDKLECSRCVNIHHRTCEDVSYIQDMCDDIEETEEFKTLYKTLTGIEQEAVQNESNVTTNLTDIQTNVDETKTNISSFRKYLDQQLDKMEEALCEEVDEIGTSSKSVLENVSAECESLISNVRAVIYNIHVSRKTQQKMRMFILMKNTQRILAEWRKEMDDLTSQNRIQQCKFEPEKRLQSMAEGGLHLGCLVMEDDRDKSPHPSVAEKAKTTAKIPQNVTVTTSQNITAVRDDTIPVEAQTDIESCWITGSVRIDERTLAIADYNNNSVKLLNRNKKKVKECLSLKHKPWNITRINEHTLAVTCPIGGYIQLVTVSSSQSLSLGPRIQAGGHCFGIRYIDAGGGRLVVSFIHPHKVKIMDLSGTVLKDLSSDAVGRPRFGIPLFITTSDDGRTIIVSNFGTGTVKGLTLDGTVKFVYRDDELWNPAGVAVGGGGEIYVCGKVSNNIHVISSQGRKVQILLKKDGMNNMYNITYFDNRLFVGNDNNHVNVYRIKYERCPTYI